MVKRPSVEVESCCHEPPAYEPRRSPAADGEDIPVPPLLAARDPVQVGVRVKVPLEFVILRPMLVSVDVARVMSPV